MSAASKYSAFIYQKRVLDKEKHCARIVSALNHRIILGISPYFDAALILSG